MYYYNNLQEDVNQVVVKALQKSSAQPWDEAAPVLYKAMEAIMEDELDEEEEEELMPRRESVLDYLDDQDEE